ncbi:MAG: hypothetical protein C4583_10005 [Anaerolineaceae bacterium]|nr:MAG: hypothetical protein C4583_10005 [Anaerolineaceae bacterium]
MRDWNLSLGDPLHLTLAADFRFGGVDYLNDQIWELDFASGEPRSLSLRTTFGLRARSMRVFPRFGEGRGIVTDPAKFVRAPRLRFFAPNFLELDFSPLPDLEVTAEFWAAGSQVVAGRYSLVNRSAKARKIRLELCAILAPLDGQAFFAAQSQMVNIITGTTGGLAPLLYMTGGPSSVTAPYPALTVDLDLAPNGSRQISWALAALTASGPSFDLARKTVARKWDAEKARIQMTAESQMVDVETGDPDWDAAFAFTQTAALRSFLPASETLPNPSFVVTRAPDQGFSHKGDGTDYPPGWAGQSPLEAYYLAGLLPGAPQFAKGLLKNFLSSQNEDGFVDLRPGLAGQRAKMLAAPLLASLAWQVYQASNDHAFLAEVFPPLLKFFWNWFSPPHDRNRDGLPEWDHLLQTGWDENPLFDVWNPWSQGMDISIAENPSLYALLAREAACLILIAEKLGRADEVALVKHQAEVLDNAVAAGWDESAALYAYRDLVTRLSLAGQVVAKGKGRAALKPKKEFERPVHLLIEIQTKSPAAKRPTVRLAEQATKEPVEVIAPDAFQWRSGGFVATTRNVYEKLGRVDILGLDAADKVIIRTIDLTAQDHTLLFPLWAGLPDQQRAQTLIGRAILDSTRFDKPFGLPAIASPAPPKADAAFSSVHLPFNQLVGEGLLAYGFHTEAARLVEHIMSAVVKNLKETRAFHQRHHAETGAPIGERHAATGLAPLGLFLQTLGVTILSSTKVKLEGKNPFPWPVTLRYRGLVVKRGLNSTEVIFANGKSVMVTDPKACIVAI